MTPDQRMELEVRGGRVSDIEQDRRDAALRQSRENALEHDLSPKAMAMKLLLKVMHELKGYKLKPEEVRDLLIVLDDVKMLVKCMEEGV